MADVELRDLVTGPSRVGVSTKGVVASVREDCGVIMRCTQCRRVLKDGVCSETQCDNYSGNQDIRLRLVIDDGKATSSLLINKDATLELLGVSEDDIVSEIGSNGQMEFVQSLRNKLLGRQVVASGRVIVDGQGAMILAEKAELVNLDPAMLRPKLGQNGGWSNATFTFNKKAVCMAYVGFRIRRIYFE